jgi:hypothetical protein
MLTWRNDEGKGKAVFFFALMVIVKVPRISPFLISFILHHPVLYSLHHLFQSLPSSYISAYRIVHFAASLVSSRFVWG